MAIVRQLLKAAFGHGFGILPHSREHSEIGGDYRVDNKDDLVERLLAELSEDSLSKHVGQPLDEARMRYAMDNVTVEDGFEFNDPISAFYNHMLRHTESFKGHANPAAISAEAINATKQRPWKI